MIKIQSLFPDRPQHKPAYVQTDLGFPKLVNYRISPKAALEMNKTNIHQMSRISKEEKMNQTGLSFSSFPNKLMKAKTESLFRTRRHENLAKDSVRQMQTKNFKFLKLQERVLNIAITNYLRNVQCSKEETQALHKKIRLSYFNNEQESDLTTYKSIKTIKNVPDVYELQTTVKEVLNIVRQFYETNTNPCYPLRERFKHIAFTVQRIVFEKKYLSLHRGQRQDCELLSMYVERYIHEIEKEKIKSKYGDKASLFKFYQQINKRYESIPFMEFQDEAPEIKTQDQKQNKAELAPPDFSKNQHRKKITVNESFIKMRFYDNFRKQVQKLTQNTDKILNQEMNRLNNFDH